MEREINGLEAAARLEARQRLVRPLVDKFHDWMRAERGTMSRHNPAAKAIAYMVKADRREAVTHSGGFRGPTGATIRPHLDDGRICLTNNAAERALRGVALGRKSWLFAGSERGGDRAAFMYSPIVTAKLNDIDPRAWLADILGRLPGTTASKLPDLLPWNWRTAEHRQAA